MNDIFFLKLKIKPEFTSVQEVLEELIDATLTVTETSIKLEIKLEKHKYLFASWAERNKSIFKIFFDVYSTIPHDVASIIKTAIFHEKSIKNHSITDLGNSVEIIFSSIEFEIENTYAEESEILFLYYGNLLSYRDFYNQYNYDETAKPIFEIARKNNHFHKLDSQVSIRPEIRIDIKDTDKETIFKKESFINVSSTLDTDSILEYVNTVDLIFSFYYRKKVKFNLYKYLVNNTGKIIYNVFDNNENERFATFYLNMSNKFILLYNINFEIVYSNRIVFADIVNLYINATQSQDEKIRFILFYSVLEILKANFTEANRTNFTFKKFNIKEVIKNCLTTISQHLTVENNDKATLRKEKDILTGEQKIEYLNQAIIYKPLKKQFDPLVQKYFINPEKYKVDLNKIVHIRSRLFHGGTLSTIDFDYLKKINHRDYFPKFITELIVKIMGGDPENYNRNIYEEQKIATLSGLPSLK